jgi:hypothetical protein
VQVLGDNNQEFYTNSACQLWEKTNQPHFFEFREFKGVGHFMMTADPTVLTAIDVVIDTLSSSA